MAAQEKPHSRFTVASTVTFYIVVAIAMVMANKWVLSKTNFPVFFLFAQLVIAVACFSALHVTGYIFRIPERPIDATLLKGLAPMVLMNVLTLNLTNLTLKFVDASFYQVARGLVLPFTVIISTYMLHARPSLLVLTAVGIVTFGFLLGVWLDMAPGGMTTTSPIGITFGILSSCTTALQAVVIKRSLDVVKGNAMDLAWYNNLFSAFVSIPVFILAGEVPEVWQLFTQQGEAFTAFLWGAGITGFLGFALCIAGFVSIKITSPITHMVSSAVRGVLQSFIAVLIFGDIITSGRASAIALILGGSIYYTWVKHLEQVEKENGSSGANAASKLEAGGYERLPMKDVDADLRKAEATQQ